MTDVNRFGVEIFLNSNAKEKPSILEEFEKKKSAGSILNVDFAGADKKGNMYYYHRENSNDYKVEMLAEDRLSKKALLKNHYPVMVKEINYETKTIYLSNRLARDVIKEQLIAEILNGLKEGRPVRTKARVSYIRKNSKGQDFLELNLAGVDVKGTLIRDNWSTCFTASLQGLAKPGDIIDVEVTGVLSPRRFKIEETVDTLPHNFIFRCSRKNAIDFNPWEGISKKFPLGSSVRIVCIEKKPDHFFARVNGLEEINAFCHYPDEDTFFIRVGGVYEARVIKVSEERKGFVLKPYRELSSGQ